MWIGLQVWGPITGKDSEQGWPEGVGVTGEEVTLACHEDRREIESDSEVQRVNQ